MGGCFDCAGYRPAPGAYSGLIYYLVRTAAAGECFRLCFECEAHSEDIPHRLLQGVIALEVWIGIDVCMDFHIDMVPGKEIAQFIRDLDALCHFHQHALLDGELMPGLLVVNEHEPAMSFAKEDDHRSKFRFKT